MRLDYSYSIIRSVESGPSSTSTSSNIQASSTTTTPPLTSIFTPPPECNTPYITFCTTGECYGYYYPLLLYYTTHGRPKYPTIQCLPETTTWYDGSVDGIYNYNPGLFCPDDMTTDTSIGGTFICCPTGLTFDGTYCYGTETIGVGFLGAVSSALGTIYDSTSFSAADGTTLYASAYPVRLIQKSAAQYSLASSTLILSNPSGTSSISESSHTSSPYQAEPASQISIKIGVGVGIAVALILFILGCILLIRYRRKRILRRQQPLDSVPSAPERIETKAALQTQKRLPPTPPMAELPVESEGPQIGDYGAGIYVWKPELEGTAGIPNSVGVYVQQKSELEANNNGIASSVLGPRPDTAPESPIVGLSYMYQRLGPP